MTRNDAYQLLTKYLHNKNLIKHSLAAEAAMKRIYEYLYKDKSTFNSTTEEIWGITGLLHDIDYEIAQSTNQLNKHGLLIFEKEPTAIPVDVAHAIKAHNYTMTNVMPENDMDWAIFCADQLTGLIVAAVLVHPEKKLAAIIPEFVLNRFKTASFAKGANRESIMLCQDKLGIPLEQFIAIVLKSMQEIHTALGL
jgi:hypothetical protein